MTSAAQRWVRTVGLWALTKNMAARTQEFVPNPTFTFKQGSVEKQCSSANENIMQTVKECKAALYASYEYSISRPDKPLLPCPGRSFIASNVFLLDPRQSEDFHTVTLSNFTLGDWKSEEFAKCKRIGLRTTEGSSCEGAGIDSGTSETKIYTLAEVIHAENFAITADSKQRSVILYDEDCPILKGIQLPGHRLTLSKGKAKGRPVSNIFADRNYAGALSLIGASSAAILISASVIFLH